MLELIGNGIVEYAEGKGCIIKMKELLW